VVLSGALFLDGLESMVGVALQSIGTARVTAHCAFRFGLLNLACKYGVPDNSTWPACAACSHWRPFAAGLAP
jgi:hypothetical protein